MKKTLLVLTILLATLTVKGQEKENLNLDKNELKINTFSLIGFGAIDVSYERIIDEESSFGLALYFNLNNNLDPETSGSNTHRTFAFTPYYRIHFSKKYNQGFFIEGFASYYKGEQYEYNSYYDYDVDYDYYSYNYNEELIDYDGLALGIGVGGKWVTKKGFVAELSLGVGRNIYGGAEDEPPVIARGGITLGKRF